MSTIIEKAKSYCAYQERSHKEARSKLMELGVYGEDLEDCILELIEENYLNEERYACAIARGKFKIKHWGRVKIKQSLKYQDISDYCIKKAMQEIDENEYLRVLDKLSENKTNELRNEKNKFVKQTKLKNFLLQRGFENDLVYDIVKKYVPLK
jgi:regulatory protein